MSSVYYARVESRTPKWVHPTRIRRPVWTLRRRVMGNLIPALGAIPLMVWGLVGMHRTGHILGKDLLWILGGLIVGWLAVNRFGLFQNRQMREDMELRLESGSTDTGGVRYFVGAATPGFVGYLDPHEDVGFLILHRDHLEFFGERLRIDLPRESIGVIRFQPNVHTLIGLGRWIAIEATLEDRPARLQVELRERPTLLGNFRLSRHVLKELRHWMKV